MTISVIVSMISINISINSINIVSSCIVSMCMIIIIIIVVIVITIIYCYCYYCPRPQDRRIELLLRHHAGSPVCTRLSLRIEARSISMLAEPFGGQ